MTAKIINRDAGEQTKGFRLQRLRALKLLLEKLSEGNKKSRVFASTEYLDDVYIKTVNSEGIIMYTEGDKNYNPQMRFSFMSHEILNSLIIFLDNWFQCDFSPNLYFCFYTNVQYTKEKNSSTIKRLKIQLPDKSILEYLLNSDINDEVLECIKKRLIYEYKEQYKGKKEEGYIDQVVNLSDVQWKDFLGRIQWKFGQYNDFELKEELIEIIKNRDFFKDAEITNKEDIAIDLLLEVFHENEQLSDIVSKHVSGTDVENIFLRISKDVNDKVNDPIYTMWNKLSIPGDTRNLREKISSVDPAYSKLKLGLKARETASMIEEYKRVTDEEKGSYRYRVFEACQTELVTLLTVNQSVDVDMWLERMFKAAKYHIQDKSKDYSYAFGSEDALKKAILELIDSCFLSFDEEGFYSEQ